MQRSFQFLLFSVVLIRNFANANLTMARIFYDGDLPIIPVYTAELNIGPSYPDTLKSFLNSFVVPDHYHIILTTYMEKSDFEKRFSFDGFVNITFTTKYHPVHQIVLYASGDFKINSVQLKTGGVFFRLDHIGDLRFDPDNDILYVNLNKALIPEQKYFLSFNYSGQMYDREMGFYKRFYRNDQRDLIGRYMDTFHLTPPIPTHLFLMVISHFDIRRDGLQGPKTRIDPLLYSQKFYNQRTTYKISNFDRQAEDTHRMRREPVEEGVYYRKKSGYTGTNILVANHNHTIDSSTDYRLNFLISPMHYDISLTTHLNIKDGRSLFTFDGYVVIIFETYYSNVKQIVLHVSKDLFIRLIDVVSKTVPIIYKFEDIVYEPWSEKLYINLRRPLIPDNDYQLIFIYSGMMNSDTEGFYRSFHESGSYERCIGITNLKMMHARKVFPCFDEPRFKTTFALKINRTNDYFSSSIARLAFTERSYSSRSVDHFSLSPIMTTSSFSFVVSDYKIRNGNPGFHTIVHPKFSDLSDYALRISFKLTEFLSRYITVPHFSARSIGKIELFATPDGSDTDAWGLITLSELELLYDPNKSSMEYVVRTVDVIANKLAKLWFGNLITYEYWGNMWFTEGMALYFQNVATTNIEVLSDRTSHLIVNDIHKSLLFESQVYHILSDPDAETPFDIRELSQKKNFGKALGLIRMLVHIMREEDFLKAIRWIISHNRFSTILLDQIKQTFDRFFDHHERIDLKEFITDWIEQPCYPVVNLTLDKSGTFVHIKVSAFHLDDQLPNKYNWIVPITLTTNREFDFDPERPHYYWQKDGPSSQHYMLNQRSEWIIGNPGQFGYYRVTYDIANWKKLGKALKRKNHSKIPDATRAQIIDDALNLARAGQLGYGLALSTIEYLASEYEYYPWAAAFAGLSFLSDRIDDRRHQRFFQQFMQYIIHYPYMKSNYFVDVDSESRLHQSQMGYWACRYKLEPCLIDAKLKFAKREKKPIPAFLEFSVYCTILRETNDMQVMSEFFEMFLSETFPARKSLLIESLGCVKNKTLAGNVVIFILRPMVQAEYKIRGLDALFEHNLDHRVWMWEYIVYNRYTVMSILHGLTTLDELLCKYSKYINNGTLLRSIPIDAYLFTDDSFLKLVKCIEQTKLNERWYQNSHRHVILYMRKYMNFMIVRSFDEFVGQFFWDEALAYWSGFSFLVSVFVLVFSWYYRERFLNLNIF